MARPKGSKNKTKEASELPSEKGNPDFNLASVEPTDVLSADYVTDDESFNREMAQSIYTDEDKALDLELERMSREEIISAPIDEAPVVTLRKEKVDFVHLSEVVENYKPATTLNELNFQVDQAKLNECNSIEASPQIVKYYCKNQFPPTAGYFWYRDVRVFMPDKFAQAQKTEKRTIYDIESKTPMAMPGSRPA